MGRNKKKKKSKKRNPTEAPQSHDKGACANTGGNTGDDGDVQGHHFTDERRLPLCLDTGHNDQQPLHEKVRKKSLTKSPEQTDQGAIRFDPGNSTVSVFDQETYPTDGRQHLPCEDSGQQPLHEKQDTNIPVEILEDMEKQINLLERAKEMWDVAQNETRTNLTKSEDLIFKFSAEVQKMKQKEKRTSSFVLNKVMMPLVNLKNLKQSLQNNRNYKDIANKIEAALLSAKQLHHSTPPTPIPTFTPDVYEILRIFQPFTSSFTSTQHDTAENLNHNVQETEQMNSKNVISSSKTRSPRPRNQSRTENHEKNQLCFDQPLKENKYIADSQKPPLNGGTKPQHKTENEMPDLGNTPPQEPPVTAAFGPGFFLEEQHQNEERQIASYTDFNASNADLNNESFSNMADTYASLTDNDAFTEINTRYIPGLKPIFLASSDVYGMIPPQNPRDWLKGPEIWKAIEQLVPPKHISGIQPSGKNWRVYLDNAVERTYILKHDIIIRGKSVRFSSQNPNRPIDSETTRVRISNVPLSADDGQIRRALTIRGCEIKQFFREKLRVDNRLTNCDTGDRIAIVKKLTDPLPRKLDIGRFHASIFHYGQVKVNQHCSDCLQTGHSTGECTNEIVCKQQGHKQADCPDQLTAEPPEHYDSSEDENTSSDDDAYTQNIDDEELPAPSDDETSAPHRQSVRQGADGEHKEGKKVQETKKVNKGKKKKETYSLDTFLAAAKQDSKQSCSNKISDTKEHKTSSHTSKD